MVRVSAWLVGAILLASLLVGCRGSGPVNHLVIVGAPCMVPLLESISRRFEQSRDNVRITIEPADAERAVANTHQGLADIGLLPRRLSLLETGLRGTVIARDGLGFIVHKDNPVQALNHAELARLLGREYTSWQSVGGPDQPVLIIAQGKDHSLREVLAEQLGLPPAQLQIDLFLSTGEQVVEEIARRPLALGCLSLGVAEPAVKTRPIRLLPLGKVKPTLANLRAGRYTLVRPLILLTQQQPGEVVKQFLDFASSQAVEDLVLEHGFALPSIP